MPEEAAGNRRNRNRKEFRKKHRLSFGERGTGQKIWRQDGKRDRR